MSDENTTLAQPNADAGDAGGLTAGVDGAGGAVQPTGDDAGWRSSLDADLRDNPGLAQIGSISDLAKGYVNAQKLVGAEKVAIPPKDAAPEVLAEFYSKLGRPAEPNAYELNPSNDLPEAGMPPPETSQAYMEQAHELGLTQRQAAGLYRWYAEQTNDQIAGATQEVVQQREQSQMALRKEWGAAYDDKINEARQAVEQFGGDELKQVLNETGLGDHPILVKVFQNIGKAMADDQLYASGQQMSTAGNLSPQEAQNQISELQRDPEFMKQYTQPGAGHDEAVKRMQSLFRMLKPQ